MKKSVLCILFLFLLLLINSNSASPQVFWEELPQMVTVPLNSASNYDCSIAYVCGDSATVLKTTNRGYNWTNVSKNGIPPNVQLVNIFVVSVSPMHTVIASGHWGTYTYVYRTTNSGANWTQVFSQSSGLINAVWFTDANSGFMQGNNVGGRWSLWKSTNAGLNWDSTGLYRSSYTTEFGFANCLWKSGANIWFGSNMSGVYHSTNNGSTWTIGTLVPESNSVAIWMGGSPYNLGYSAANTLYKTTNAGVNWTLDLSAVGSGAIKTITGSTEIFNYVFYTRGGTIYYKNINVGNWNVQYTAPAGTYNHMSLARVSMYYGPGWIYAVRNNGRISRANTYVEGVRLISNNVPDSYTLSQNYPNPFNPSTKFKFDTRRLPEMSTGEIRGGNVRISVYDNLGRETETLINKVLQPAEYEIDWNGSKYPSGVYFYRMLVTNPNGGVVVFDAVKKMVLMK